MRYFFHFQSDFVFRRYLSNSSLVGNYEAYAKLWEKFEAGMSSEETHMNTDILEEVKDIQLISKNFLQVCELI